MIPYGRQSINSADIEAMVLALKGNLITTGPIVSEFETALSNFLNTETFVVSSGTAALHCAYFGVGIEPGDEVITPPNTFIATQAAAAMLGAKIVFADIDLNTGLISIDSVRERITRKTKAIVLVDYAGQPCDVDAFRDLIGHRKIFLIEDAAHSFGSLYKGQPVGSVADVTTFSFYPTKNITTGEGGAVSALNSSILNRAKRFARQGMVKDPQEFLISPDGPWHQEVHEFGMNYRLTDFQCALGLSQLKRFSMFISRRSEIVAYYKEAFRNRKEIRLLPDHSQNRVVHHLFPIFVNSELRSDLFAFLRERAIGAQINYFPASAHPVFQTKGQNVGNLTQAEKFYREEISLPLHVELKNEELHYIVQVINEFFDAL
jgi:dTDP-4-amino-4,6-dideoxygalactose transaminase